MNGHGMGPPGRTRPPTGGGIWTYCQTCCLGLLFEDSKTCSREEMLPPPTELLELLRANAQEKGKNSAKTGQARHQKTLAKAAPLPTFEAFVMPQLFEITRVGRQPELPQQRLEDYDFVIFTDGGVHPTNTGPGAATIVVYDVRGNPQNYLHNKQTTFKERRREVRCRTYFLMNGYGMGPPCPQNYLPTNRRPSKSDEEK